MSEKFNNLINILNDSTARIDEKDDAIILLAELGDKRALEHLYKIGSDENQDYILKSSAGESMAAIMIENNYFDEKYIIGLTKDARHEAVGLIVVKKPEWRNFLESKRI